MPNARTSPAPPSAAATRCTRSVATRTYTPTKMATAIHPDGPNPVDSGAVPTAAIRAIGTAPPYAVAQAGRSARRRQPMDRRPRGVRSAEHCTAQVGGSDRGGEQAQDRGERPLRQPLLEPCPGSRRAGHDRPRRSRGGHPTGRDTHCRSGVPTSGPFSVSRSRGPGRPRDRHRSEVANCDHGPSARHTWVSRGPDHLLSPTPVARGVTITRPLSTPAHPRAGRTPDRSRTIGQRLR